MVDKFFAEYHPSVVVNLAAQAGDVPVTYADTTPLETDFGFKLSTSLRNGLRRFAEWYKNYMS